MKRLLMSLSCPALVCLGVFLIGIHRPSPRQILGYFCLYLAGHLLNEANQDVTKESTYGEPNEG